MSIQNEDYLQSMNGYDYPDHGYAAAAPVPPVSCREYVGASERYGFGRFVAEILLYISLILGAFGEQIGTTDIPLLGGAIILLCGLVTAGIMLAEGKKIPTSIWFALAITILANVSDVINGQRPLNTDVNEMLFWMCRLLIACHLFKNDKAAHRAFFFLALCTLLAVGRGGLGEVTGAGQVKRLTTGEQVIGALNGPNGIGPAAACAATFLLIFSLHCSKKFKLFYWIAALVMSYIAVRTVGRMSTVLLAGGILGFVTIVMFTKGGKLGFIMLIFLTIGGVARYTYTLTRVKETAEIRFRLGYDRLAMNPDLRRDVAETVLFGMGREEQFRRYGNIPHVPFYFLHLTYGGPVAYIYTAWLILLSVRCWRTFWSREVDLRYKLEMITALGLLLLIQFSSVFAPAKYGILLVTAMLEKYTAPFSLRRVRLRRFEHEALAMLPPEDSEVMQPQESVFSGD